MVEFMSHPGLSERPGSPLMRVPEYEFWRGGEARELLRELGGTGKLRGGVVLTRRAAPPSSPLLSAIPPP
ncbi:MAG: hypothetical protein WKG07_03260 [Hymenobacter sp.]